MYYIVQISLFHDKTDHNCNKPEDKSQTVWCDNKKCDQQIV